MGFLSDLIRNPLFLSAAVGWFSAQFIKTIIYIIIHKEFNPERLMGAGGMPSSHSATVCALVTATAIVYGPGGFELPMAVFFAFIVMYDAMGVRRETGEQAKVLNEMLTAFRDMGKTLQTQFHGIYLNGGLIMTAEQIKKDMVAAAKAGDKEKKLVLSAMYGAVKKLAIDEGSRDNITEDQVGRALTKELRAAKESLETCPASREDLIKEYTYRYNLIAEYAPKMLSKDEIRSFLEKECADVIASKNKGMIMKTVMPLLKGKADGKDISAVVAELTK